MSEGGLALTRFWSVPGRGSGYSAVRAAQLEPLNLRSKSGCGLEWRFCDGITLPLYWAVLSSRFCGLAGFPGGTTAIPGVNEIEQRGGASIDPGFVGMNSICSGGFRRTHRHQP